MRAWLLALALAPALAAADPRSLSTLPGKPARYAQAEGALHAKVELISPSYRVTGDGAACLVGNPPAYWIDGDASLDTRVPDLYVSAGEQLGIERLVERGEAAELERIRAELVGDQLVPRARSRIPLHEVARLEGLTVYAYRWDTKVVVLTRAIAIAALRRDGGSGVEAAPECGVVQTMLRVRGGSSQPVQIRGVVPATGKAFLVDASVTQTGRDPEPLLSVTARLLDR